VAASVVAVGWVVLAGVAGIGDWPTLTPGLWRFHRVVTRVGSNLPPDSMTNTSCADPVQDMRTRDAQLTKMGCTFTGPVRKGNAYTFGSTCTIQGRTARSTSVLTVLNPGAYRLTVNAQMGTQATREILEARRVGDCPK
jgi:hypothetical protein